MYRLLLIEHSATLRHAVKKVLAQTPCEIVEVAGYEAGRRQLEASAAAFDGVLIGWPSRTDPAADELLALLEGGRQRGLPAVVLSERPDPAKLNWTTRRPAALLQLWRELSELPEALGRLLQRAPTAPPAFSGALTVAEKASIRILFVDDSPTVRVSFRKLLTRHGYAVDTAASVAEGMQQALNQQYDIAIVDYFMPEACGDELCRQLRDEPRTREVATAVITGTYLDKVIMDALAAGALECMFKNEAEALFLARVDAMSAGIIGQRQMTKERERLAAILCSVGDGVYGVDTDGRITCMNPVACQILGFNSDADCLGQRPHTLFHSRFQDGTSNPIETCFLSRAYASGERLNSWQTVFWTREGRPLPVECTVQPLYIDERRAGSVIAFRDVSERKLMEEELRWQANHDSLTKLLNRHYFENQLEQEVQRLRRSEETSALLYIDLDQFKYINDTAGHAAGDRLLIDVGHILQTRLRASDTLARLGGDEFAIILRNVREGEAYESANEFRRLIGGKPFLYAGKSYKVTSSIGIALMDRFCASPGEALASADLACHIAKEQGRNCAHVYRAEHDQRRAMDLELGWSARLHEALENDQFELVFHPIVPLRQLRSASVAAIVEWAGATGRVEHFEVLLRLKGGQGEIILPEAFLPTAERFNLMPQIDRWVLGRALETLARQRAAGRKLQLSINLSAHTITDPALAADIRALILEHGIDPCDLCFEITETCAISNLDAAQNLIGQLRALGVRFALDDFGSGFCSFGHLKNLAVDFIKIDGLFTQGVVSDPIDRAVVLSIVQIAHALGIETVAEFVENEEILRHLSDCGVDYVQGNLIARPQASLRLASVNGRLTAAAGLASA